MSRLMDRGQGSRKERGEGRGTSHDASVIINSDSARTWCATECHSGGELQVESESPNLNLNRDQRSCFDSETTA